MAESIDGLIAGVAQVMGRKELNRFRTMVCLVNELGLHPSEYRGTAYYQSLPRRERAILDYSVADPANYSEVKGMLLQAGREAKSPPHQGEGINIMRILMSYGDALRHADDPSAVDVGLLPVSPSRRRGKEFRAYNTQAEHMLEAIVPGIQAHQKGEDVPPAIYCASPSQRKALDAYQRIIYGVKKLSPLERDALHLLPRGRAGNDFLAGLRQVTVESDRKWMIYSELKKAYGR